MTPAERAAVHALAGAFGRLSLAAELVYQTPAGPARAALVDRMEAARKLALAEFAAAQNVLAAERPPQQASSEAPAKPPPSILAAEAPPTSTTPRLPPDAGGRRAVSARASKAPKPGTLTEAALKLAAVGPFTTLDLARATGRDVAVCTTVCSQLKQQGVLAYAKVSAQERMRGVRGTYSLPGAAEPAPPVEDAKPRRSMEPRPARAGEPLADEAAELARYGVRRVPVEQAVRVSARSVPGVHTKVADFFADKPALPPARPVTPRYA